MNQDQIASFLTRVRPASVDFTVILTGKRSRKVNGLYKPETREILLHNKNFQSDADMLRTALHEYAHHLHHTSSAPPSPGRPHTASFWALFHDLLGVAEKKGLYTDVFRSDKEFVELTRTIKASFLEPYGALLQDFGKKLLEAEALCRGRNLNFRDYVERELGLKLPTARLGMETVKRFLDPTLGPDKLKALSRLPAEVAQSAGKLFAEGATEAQVMAQFSPSVGADSTTRDLGTEKTALKKKQARLKILIAKYQRELREVENQMKMLGTTLEKT